MVAGRRGISDGEEFLSAGGFKFKVYLDKSCYRGNYLCEFDDITLERRASSILSGKVTHPNDTTCYGIGYQGIGEYSSKNQKVAHYKWTSMLKRCYSGLHEYRTYSSTTVRKDWLNFQVFCKWFLANNIDGYDLDKDFKCIALGLNEYSEETCIFIPHKTNTALSRKPKEPPPTNRGFRSFIRVDKGRLPLGVYSSKVNARYINYCAKLGYIEGLIRETGRVDLIRLLPEFGNNYMRDCYENIRD